MTAAATPCALRVGEFRKDRPAKATVRHLVRIGALPTLPRGRAHLTRDVFAAVERVRDGVDWLRERRRLAGQPPGNPSWEEGWAEWCRRHPASEAARGGAAKRREFRELRRAQGDLFQGPFGGGAR